jgi:hypothetical protein
VLLSLSDKLQEALIKPSVAPVAMPSDARQAFDLPEGLITNS